MTTYDDDNLDDDVEEVETVEEVEEPAPSNNRNFLLALGVLGGIFILLIIALALLFLNRPRTAPDTANIESTNQAILIANTQTAGAATQSALILQAVTATPTATRVQPTSTVTATSVVALATATETPVDGGAGGALITVTPNIQTRTATIGVVLTQSAQQTQAVPLTRTAAIRLTQTATRLPSTGFAEDVGLPGLFGLALGLVVVIVLVRRLRLSTGG